VAPGGMPRRALRKSSIIIWLESYRNFENRTLKYSSGAVGKG
jgi:hypothetical protein